VAEGSAVSARAYIVPIAAAVSLGSCSQSLIFAMLGRDRLAIEIPAGQLVVH